LATSLHYVTPPLLRPYLPKADPGGINDIRAITLKDIVWLVL
jgi:hypothetical protein